MRRVSLVVVLAVFATFSAGAPASAQVQDCQGTHKRLDLTFWSAIFQKAVPVHVFLPKEYLFSQCTE